MSNDLLGPPRLHHRRRLGHRAGERRRGREGSLLRHSRRTHEAHLDDTVDLLRQASGDDLQSLADYTNEQFDRVIDIDLRGTFFAMKHELRHMIPFEHGGGRRCC